MLKTVTVRHPFNGEEQVLPVERVTRNVVTLRWGQSGLYDLDLRTNTITARSIAARRKGKCLWCAVYIDNVRVEAMLHVEGEDKRRQMERDIERHQASMPRGELRAKKL